MMPTQHTSYSVWWFLISLSYSARPCHNNYTDLTVTDDVSESVVSQELDLDITLRRDSPSVIISQSQLSQSDLPVFYREENNTPGLWMVPLPGPQLNLVGMLVKLVIPTSVILIFLMFMHQVPTCEWNSRFSYMSSSPMDLPSTLC